MKFFDPDNMNKIPHSARRKMFIPIEEVPDPSPNPSEILMEKEDLLTESSVKEM